MLVVCLGIAVLAVALFALHEPNGHVAAAESSSNTSGVADHTTKRSTGKPGTSHTSSPNSTDTDSADTDSAVHDVPLVVLNNTTTPALAKQAAARFQAGGWTVTSYGNLVNDIVSTCAYYDPANSAAHAAALALQHQYPTIKRVRPKFSGLPDGPVVVVLTPDYSSE